MKEQMTQLATQDTKTPVVRYETERGEVALSVDFVRSYFCKEASPTEAFAFIRLCQYHRLNPFLREAYLVKYGERDSAQFIVGYQAWTQRAEKDPNYKGFRAGLILAKQDGTLEYREGTFYRQGETLEGGWCEVKLTYRSDPVRIEVAVHEYAQKTRDGRPNKFWGEKPGTMIRKVAIAQAHREAFPSLFAGLYDQAEMDGDNELPTDAVVVEGSGSWLEDVDTATGEIREPQESPTGDILPPDEGPDEPPANPVPEAYRSLVDRAGNYGFEVEGFCKTILGASSIEQFEKMGGNPGIAQKRLDNYEEKQRKAGV
jgi:phage recombination protein Bet